MALLRSFINFFVALHLFPANSNFYESRTDFGSQEQHLLRCETLSPVL